MKDITFTVTENKFVADGVFEMKLEAGEPLPEIRAGQFLHLKIDKRGLLLRRPFCISAFYGNTVVIYVAVVGKGTTELSAYSVGEKLNAILPIGNGFTLEEKHRSVALLAGGVGGAALTSLKYGYPDKKYSAFIGFTGKNKIILEDEYKSFCDCTVCTDDGSYGYKGFPTTAFVERLEKDPSFRPDVILTCGSEPFLKAVAAVSVKTGIPAYMSGESRMGCGVGACLVCACALRGEDGKTVHRRACVDGPVFNLKDVIL